MARTYKKRISRIEIARLMNIFNITREEISDFLRGYNDHEDRATVRNIPFLFSQEEWIRKWIKSGHWHERGCKIGQYCMHRIGDIGSYSYSNTRIILHRKNISIGLKGNKNFLNHKHSEKSKALVSASLIGNQRAVGSKRTKSHKEKIRQANIGNKNAEGHRWTEEKKLKLA